MKTAGRIILIAILGLLALAPPARAGQDRQGFDALGVEVQGPGVQGVEVQGPGIQGVEVQGPGVQGVEVQGPGIQGAEVQGHSPQGTALRPGVQKPRPWLQGDRLLGLLYRPHALGHGGDAIGALEIIGFRGDRVLALSGSGHAGWKPVELSPRELVGMTWLEHRCESSLDCERFTYRIVAAEPDTSYSTMPRYSHNHDTWLYHIEYTRAASPGPGDWQSACPRVDGKSAMGMFVDGRWSADGSWRPGGYTFACTSGVISKCARSWGYKPWKRLLSPAGVLVDMRPLHQACMRAARADYCGDGISHTREGTMIDMFDIHGFNIKESGPEFAEEAGFTPRGARWVARERWPEKPTSDSPWTTLSTCRRPRYAPASPDDPVLIHVWSRRQRALHQA
jgi:hypothetical protein